MTIDASSQSETIDASEGFAAWIDQVRAFAERSLREISGN